MKKVLLLLFSTLAFSLLAQNVPQLGKASIDRIISAMTLQEKAQILVGGNREVSITNIVGNTKSIVPGAGGTTVSIPRLGIKATVMTDGPTGIRIDTVRPGTDRKYYATGFPISTLLASTWNTALVRKVGEAMGNEVKEYGCDVLLAPAMNIHRNPLNGRNFEYYSEDPLLSGKTAAAMVVGLQSNGIGATVKHFAANNQQTCRMFNDSRMSQRALREIYLKNFEIAIKEAKPWAVMSSYNRLNGEFTQYSFPLLMSLLRDEWGFKGIVMTDWTDPRITAKQIHAGNDLLMGGTQKQVDDIIAAVKSGNLSMADVDRNVRHVLEYILKTHRFKGDSYTDNPDFKAHAIIARDAADEGIILLKNDSDALPMQKNIKTVAMFGIGSYYFYANGRGSADVSKAYTVDMKQGLSNAGFIIHPKLDLFYNKYLEGQNVQLDELNVPNWHNWFFGFKKAKEPAIDSSYVQLRAKDSDIAIITIARDAGEDRDRRTIEGDWFLTETERQLIADVSRYFHALSKRVIVVLNTGGVIETASWKNFPDAIVLAWQPGQEGGNCVADILTGKVNPSGKLPMTFSNRYEDLPSAGNFPSNYIFSWKDFQDTTLMDKKGLGITEYKEDIFVGYRYFETNQKPVSFPFGYGLSYTTFEFGNARIKRSGNLCTVSVNVRNTGHVAGKEVVELYTTAPKSNLEKPMHELKAYAKTDILKPGESQTVTMTFNVADLASFDESIMSWVTDPGIYTISLGASVEDIRQTMSLNVKKPIVRKVTTKI